MSTVDLNDPPPGQRFNFAIETQETAGEHAVRLFKDVALFLLAIGFVCLLVTLCYRTLTSASASPDAQKWAMSIFSLLGGGIVGYLVPRR